VEHGSESDSCPSFFGFDLELLVSFVSFPLDGGGWFAGDVVADAVHTLDFVDDAGGDAGEDFLRHADPIGCHAVMTANDAQGDGVVVGSLVAHDTHGAHWQENGEGLPDFVIPLEGSHFLDHDGIRLAHDAQALGSDGSYDADCETRTWEWLAVDDFLGESEFFADTADFVFEELAQGLNELEFHALGEASDVVVALDQGGGIARNGNTLDHIGVECALGQEAVMAGICLLEIFGGSFEDFDEFVTDDFAFFLGVGDAFKFCKKLFGGIHRFHADAELSGEEFFHSRAFVGAEEAVIHENACQAVTDGFVQECCGYGGVHAAAQTEDDASIADLLLDFSTGAIDEGFHRPVGFAAADAVDKVCENLAAAWCVDDFGMELKAVDVALGVTDYGMRGVFCFAKWTKACRELGDFVPVAVPDIQRRGKLLEEGALGIAFELAGAVFAFG